MTSSGQRSEITLQSIIVFITSFVITFVAEGLPMSFSVYTVEFVNYFQDSRSNVSWILSINATFQLVAGLLVSVLLRVMSHRTISCIGSILSTIGCIACFFAINIPYLSFFYGIITGTGHSLVCFAMYLLICNYFTDYLPLTTACLSVSSSIGVMIFPLCLSLLIDAYSWRGSLLVVAGINLQLLVLSRLLFKPEHRVFMCGTSQANLSNSNHGRTSDAENDDLIFSNEAKVTRDLSRTDCISNQDGECQLLDISTKSFKNVGSVIVSEKSINTKLDNVEYQKGSFVEPVTIETDCRDNTDTSTRDNDESHKSFLKDFVEVITNFNLSVFFLSNFCWNMASITMLVFLADYLVEKYGKSLGGAADKLFFLGLGLIFGGIMSGIFANMTRFDVVKIYTFCCLTTGVSSFLFILYVSDAWLTFFFILFGTSLGGVLAMQIAATTKLTPKQYLLPLSFSYVMFANGIVSMIGPPIGGLLFDYTQEYSMTFYFAGSLNTLSGLLMFLLYVRRCKTVK